jgi:hypothetical protein
METLPCEIWDLILRQLAVHDIHSVAIVCKWFYGLIDDLYGCQFKIDDAIKLHRKKLNKSINSISTYYFNREYRTKYTHRECFEIVSCINTIHTRIDKPLVFYYRMYYEEPIYKNSYKYISRCNVLHTYVDKEQLNVSHIITDYFNYTEIIYDGRIDAWKFFHKNISNDYFGQNL